MVKHEGLVTRIASGCDDGGIADLRATMRSKQHIYPFARVHFTPHFSTDAKTGKDYKFYNKPHGILHWLTHGEGAAEAGVIALIDPDQVFLRPLTVWVANETNVLVTGPVKIKDLPLRVSPGRPVAQFYGLGDKWIQFNREYICGAGSPCIDVDSKDAWRHYTVGPPYVLHVEDWKKVAQSWVHFVPKVYEEYPNLLAEMYAYCLAAAHHELPHARVDHLMVSNVGAYGEGWAFVDRMASVCDPGIPLRWTPAAQLPTFLHFCQSYRVKGSGSGNWRFSKRSVSKDLFTNCDATLLPRPPSNASMLQPEASRVMLTSKQKPKLTKEEKAIRDVKRSAFMVCTVTSYVNEAMTRHKSEFCQSGG